MRNILVLIPLLLASVASQARAEQDAVEHVHDVADPLPEILPVPDLAAIGADSLVPETLVPRNIVTKTTAQKPVSVKRRDALLKAQVVKKVVKAKKTTPKAIKKVAKKKKTTPKKKKTTPKKKTTTKKKTTSTKKSPQPTTAFGNGKRGLAYNDVDLTQPWGTSLNSSSQVTWTYNWYSYACGWASFDCNYNTGLEYIPMLWSNASDLTSVWPAAVQAAIANGTTAVFTFNEPDLCVPGSACMTVASAVQAWKAYVQPLAGQVLLGAPAVTNGGAPYGLTWLTQFMKACDGCTFDFINVHWYSNIYAGASYFEQYINSTRAVANGLPIWVTEFGLTSDDPYTEAQQGVFLQTSMSWMDQQDDIARYAYFMDAAGSLMDAAGTNLSAAGLIYNTYTNTTLQPYIG